MILKGNQRSGAANLAQHLMKDENEHVEIAELRHFTSDTLLGAFNEIQAAAQATRCKQYLFSCSFNPPETVNVSTETFFDAIERLEKRLGCWRALKIDHRGMRTKTWTG